MGSKGGLQRLRRRGRRRLGLVKHGDFGESMRVEWLKGEKEKVSMSVTIHGMNSSSLLPPLCCLPRCRRCLFGIYLAAASFYTADTARRCCLVLLSRGVLVKLIYGEMAVFLVHV